MDRRTVKQDPARDLTERFKKEGHFDKLKQEILAKTIECGGDSKTIQEALKLSVSDVVRQLVNEDEEIVFKNRGSTSAMLEGQLIKNNYAKIKDSEFGVDVEKFVGEALSDPAIIDEIKRGLVDMTADEKKEEGTDKLNVDANGNNSEKTQEMADNNGEIAT